ncbi:Flp family type IVb pilin [Thioclava sp. BHET1]|nr:Flp family type IVb pilin [Thioclava sp. BHET1]
MLRKFTKATARIIAAFRKDEDGATAIEYGLFAALIAAVLVAVVTALGINVQNGFYDVCTSLSSTSGTHNGSCGSAAGSS